MGSDSPLHLRPVGSSKSHVFIPLHVLWSNSIHCEQEIGFLSGLGSYTFYQIQIQIHVFRCFKYKYKYTGKNLIKYKYKYKYSSSNTNAIQIHNEAKTKLPPFYRWHIKIYCIVRKLFYLFNFHWKLFPKVQSTISLIKIRIWPQTWFLQTPPQQTAQGYLPDFWRRSWSSPETRSLVFFMLTQDPLISMPTFHALSLEIHPPWVSVINTKSSAQRTGLGSNTSLYLQIQIQIRCICICIWSNVKSCICFCICIWSTIFGVFHKYVVKYFFSALRESIPMLFNGGGGRTTMTTRCGPACSQVLPVKPQGLWAIGVEAWAGSRDLESGVSEAEVFRALQPNAGHFLNKSLWNTNLHEYSYKHVKECYSFSK